jgi:hypothetical protein
MELLILGGLAYVGALHGKHKQTCRNKKNVEYYPAEILSIDDANKGLIEKVGKHLQSESTVVTQLDKQMPFFRSERSQNTNTGVKDRRLATFTGVGMIEYDRKQEIKAPDPSRDLTNIHGSVFNPDIDRYKKSLSTSTHNNVSSTESQYVGPGLGLKEGEAATGGFHQNYRIKPGNVNGYRKHNFEGRILSGKRPVDELQEKVSQLQVSDRSVEPETSYRGFDSTQSSVNGPMVHSDELLGCTNRSAGPSTSGTITGQTGSYNQIVSTRDSSTLSVSNHHGNPTGSSHGRYNDGSYIIHSTERGSHGNVLNAASPASGNYTKSAVDIHTLRDQPSSQVNQLNLASTGVHAPNVDRSGYEAKPTQRFFPDAYIGNANKSNSSGGYVNQTTETRPTMRNSPSSVQHGPANGTSFGTRQYKDVYTGSQCNDKREQTLVSNYRPNSHASSIQSDPHETVNAHFKNDDRWSNTLLSPTLLPNPNRNNNLETNSLSKTKTNAMNQRDFGYAQTLLKNNPFAIDITQQ